MHPPVGTAFSGPKPDGISELAIKSAGSTASCEASGGLYSDFYIHNIDELLLDEERRPVSAQASGGPTIAPHDAPSRRVKTSIRILTTTQSNTVCDGSELCSMAARWSAATTNSPVMPRQQGAAVISTSSHSPAYCRIYKGKR